MDFITLEGSVYIPRYTPFTPSSQANLTTSVTLVPIALANSVTELMPFFDKKAARSTKELYICGIAAGLKTN